MYRSVYQILTENNIIYDLQFGFRPKFFTAHALINLIENTRQALDEEYIGCVIFADLKKSFDTVDREIPLVKRNLYCACGVSKDWFRSYLSNPQQYISINDCDSGLTKINCDVPQGSFLGALPFLLYINDLKVHQVIKSIFSDDTNLLYLGKSIKKLNRIVNIDQKTLANWLNTNKISVNVKKTEMVIFRSKRKKFNDRVSGKLSGKRISPGFKIDQHFSWQHQVNDLSVKLNRTNALLFKIRKFADDKLLRSTYFAIFEFNLSYC